MPSGERRCRGNCAKRRSGGRRHATEAEYAAWVKAFVPHYAARYERVASYRRFVQAWPDLEDWFQAPLLVRAGLTGGPLRATGRTGTFDASGYLVYLALVHGVGLDYEFLFVRKYARLFSIQAGGKGLGADLDLFEAHTTRLNELGYSPESARTTLPGRSAVSCCIAVTPTSPRSPPKTCSIWLSRYGPSASGRTSLSSAPLSIRSPLGK